MQRRIDSLQPKARDALVGTKLQEESPDEYARLLALSVAKQSAEEAEARLSPLKPKNCKSKVWDHFAYYEGYKNLVFCRQCCPPDMPEEQWRDAGKLKRSTSGSTKALRGHLKRVHNICLDELVDGDSPQKREKGPCEGSVEWQQVCLEAMVKGACLRGLYPFRVWEDDSMKAVLSVVSPSLKPPSAKQVKRTAVSIIDAEKEARKKHILENFSEKIPMLAQVLGFQSSVFFSNVEFVFCVNTNV